MGPQVRSFGSSMTDFNRIPKLLYYAYQANWIPYATKPIVALAHHWNRSGVVTVNAFSNCPKVRLTLNGTTIGTDQVPNPIGTSTQQASNLTEQSTVLPMEATWQNVTWASGTLRADCLDATGTLVAGAFDQRVTAGAADHIVLTVAPPVVRPDGTAFQIQANGTDAGFVMATVVDAQGNWVPTFNGIVTFSVTGPGTYPRQLGPAGHRGTAADLSRARGPQPHLRRRPLQGGRQGAVHSRNRDRDRLAVRWPEVGYGYLYRERGDTMRRSMKTQSYSALSVLSLLIAGACSSSSGSGSGSSADGGADSSAQDAHVSEASTNDDTGSGGSPEAATPEASADAAPTDSGEDAAEAAPAPTCGAPPNRYTVLTGANAGLVLDNMTGLTWMKDSEGGGERPDAGGPQTQSDAATYCKSRGMRLPTEKRKRWRLRATTTRRAPSAVVGHMDVDGAQRHPRGRMGHRLPG